MPWRRHRAGSPMSFKCPPPAAPVQRSHPGFHVLQAGSRQALCNVVKGPPCVCKVDRPRC